MNLVFKMDSNLVVKLNILYRTFGSTSSQSQITHFAVDTLIVSQLNISKNTTIAFLNILSNLGEVLHMFRSI